MSSALTVADLRSILEFSVALARCAGVIIKQGSDAMHSVSDIGEKLNAVDLVTEYDVKIEELVKSECARAYPTFKL
jgi:myo-inositol-1(or 4)-monophosphatase